MTIISEVPAGHVLIKLKNGNYKLMSEQELADRVELNPAVNLGRKSRSPVTKYCRQLGLVASSLKRGGIWPNGRQIDTEVVLGRLVEWAGQISDWDGMTVKGTAAYQYLRESHGLFIAELEY